MYTTISQFPSFCHRKRGQSTPLPHFKRGKLWVECINEEMHSVACCVYPQIGNPAGWLQCAKNF